MELSVELLVEGVGATPLPLPPVASVYHLMLLPLATKAVALAVAQYTTGDAAVGLAGVGLTMKAKVAVFPVQSDVAGTTLMVVETTFCELFKALNPAAILPVPATPKPTLVGVDQLNVVLGVALVNAIAFPFSPAHSAISAMLLATGLGFTVMINVLAVPSQVLAVGITLTVAVVAETIGFVTV